MVLLEAEPFCATKRLAFFANRQRRLSASCPAGTYVTGAQIDGTLICTGLTQSQIVDIDGADWAPLNTTFQLPGVGLVHGPMAQSQFTERSFANLKAHCNLRISMRVWATGSFDVNEAVSVHVDTKLVWTDARSYTASDRDRCLYDWKNFTSVGFPDPAPFCYQDIEAYVSHTSSSALLRVTANVNQVAVTNAATFSGLQIEVGTHFCIWCFLVFF